MKRLFSILMVAVAATAAFAFTTPKKAAFATTYHYENGVWVTGEGAGCTGSALLCQFSTVQDVDDAALTDIASKISGSGNQQVQNIDHDNDPQTAAIPVDVTNILRFP